MGLFKRVFGSVSASYGSFATTPLSSFSLWSPGRRCCFRALCCPRWSIGRMTQQLWVDHLPQQGNSLQGHEAEKQEFHNGLLHNSSRHFETTGSVLLFPEQYLHLCQIHVTSGRELNLLKVAPTNPSSPGDVKRSLSGAAEFTKTIMAHLDACV